MKNVINVSLIIVTVIAGAIIGLTQTKADYDYAYCQFEQNGQVVVKQCDSFNAGDVVVTTDNMTNYYPTWKWKVPYVTEEGGDSSLTLDCLYDTSKEVNGKYELTSFGCTIEE